MKNRTVRPDLAALAAALALAGCADMSGIDPQSATRLFYVSALIFLLLIPLVWLSHPQPSPASGPDAAAAAH